MFQLTACRKAGKVRLPVTATDSGITQVWDEAHWCGKATVEGLTYLAAATPSEGFMEVLLDEED